MKAKFGFPALYRRIMREKSVFYHLGEICIPESNRVVALPAELNREIIP
jgi:hypothetical protein